MRNNITNPRTLRRLERETGLKIEWAQTRGGTDHRYDLFCAGGVGYHYYRGEKPVRHNSSIPPPLPVADQAEVAAHFEEDMAAVFAELVKSKPHNRA